MRASREVIRNKMALCLHRQPKPTIHTKTDGTSYAVD